MLHKYSGIYKQNLTSKNIAVNIFFVKKNRK